MAIMCRYCQGPMGDPDEHRNVCVGYMSSFEPWWSELFGVGVWVVGAIIIAFVFDWIFD